MARRCQARGATNGRSPRDSATRSHADIVEEVRETEETPTEIPQQERSSSSRAMSRIVEQDNREAITSDGPLVEQVHRILEALDKLREARLPTIMTSHQREGHYVSLRSSFHESDSPRVTRYGGKGNWALALSAYLLVPDIRSKFGKEKKLGDWVEASAVYHETMESPPPWTDLLYSYMPRSGSICSDGAYNALSWSMAPKDLVAWAVKHTADPQAEGEAGDPALLQALSQSRRTPRSLQEEEPPLSVEDSEPETVEDISEEETGQPESGNGPSAEASLRAKEGF